MRFALFALVATVCAASLVSSKDIRSEVGYRYQHRQALGHFADEPYLRLYQFYANKFVKPFHADRPDDDYRNFVPSFDECVVFFDDYNNNGKKVEDFDEFVKLDACLGYLYQSKHHEEDTDGRDDLAADLQKLIDTEEYRTFFEGTKVDDESVVPLDGQKCLGNLLLDSILAKAQFQEKTCNNAWIQVFVKFAGCSKHIPEELRETDTYLKTLFGLVKERASGCFNSEITTINEAVRDTYANKKLTRASNTMLSFVKTMREQAKERRWPRPIQKLLAAVQGIEDHKAEDNVAKHLVSFKRIRNRLKTTDKSQGAVVNLRTVAGIVRGVAGEDRKEFKEELLNNMAKYADSKILPTKTSDETIKDPKGVKRYRDLVDDLCKDFRSSDREEGFDFGLALVRMIRMLPYEDVLGVSKETFVKNILTDAFESAALYLSVSSCNILTYTEGRFIQEPNNGPLHYKVKFTEDTTGMVKWPVPNYY